MGEESMRATNLINMKTDAKLADFRLVICGYRRDGLGARAEKYFPFYENESGETYFDLAVLVEDYERNVARVWVEAIKGPRVFKAKMLSCIGVAS
jgi:hypothetical protein